jgi:hypothetical protein
MHVKEIKDDNLVITNIRDVSPYNKNGKTIYKYLRHLLERRYKRTLQIMLKKEQCIQEHNYLCVDGYVSFGLIYKTCNNCLGKKNQ